MFRKYLSGCAAILFAVMAQGQTPLSLSLSEAKDYAVEHHPDMLNSKLDIENGRATLQSRTSVGLPQINGSLGYNHFITLPTSLVPAEFFGGEPGDFAAVQFGTPENVTAGISLSQLLFSGPYMYGVQAARVYVDLLQQQAEVTEAEIRRQVELAYYGALISRRMIEMAENNVNLMKQTLNEVSALNKAGFVEALDVDRLTMSKSTLETFLTNSQRQYEFALQVLKFQMGLDQSQPVMLTDSIQSLPDMLMLQPNDQQYLNRPEFDVMTTTKRLNELNISVNKAAYYPSLALIGNYEQAAQRNEFNFFDGNEPWFETFLVGVQLNVPIFSGLQRSVAVDAARIGYDKAAVAEQNLLQAIQLEIAQHTTAYQNAQADLENANANIALAERIYQASLIKYREGIGSSLELTDAEGTLIQAQISYINALYALLSANTNLKKALGY